MPDKPLLQALRTLEVGCAVLRHRSVYEVRRSRTARR
jgi:hypothetical protein